MRQFTKEQIEQTKAYFQSKHYPLVNIDFGGALKFCYFLISQNENPELKDFALAMPGITAEDGRLFGVSDSLDRRFSPFWAAHEFIESTQFGNEPDGCAKTLEIEISLVPDSFKPKYVPRRLEFFRNLFEYAHRNNYPGNDISNFRHSLERLEQLARKL